MSITPANTPETKIFSEHSSKGSELCQCLGCVKVTFLHVTNHNYSTVKQIHQII